MNPYLMASCPVTYSAWWAQYRVLWPPLMASCPVTDSAGWAQYRVLWPPQMAACPVTDSAGWAQYRVLWLPLMAPCPVTDSTGWAQYRVLWLPLMAPCPVTDSAGWAQYRVLWLPSRFHQLKLYVVTASICALVLLVPALCRLLARHYHKLRQEEAPNRGLKNYYGRLSSWSLSSSKEELYHKLGYRRIMRNAS